MRDGESTDYGATSEAARKDTRKPQKTKITLNEWKPKCISCHYVCAHISVFINKDKKVELQLKKRGGLDKQWVHFKAKKHSTVGAMCVFVLFHF